MRVCKSPVIARRSKGQGGRLGIGGPHLPSHVETHEEHHDEVDQERHCNSQHMQRSVNDLFALQAEHHDDRKQKGDQGDGTDLRDELLLSPGPPPGLNEHEPRRHPGQEGDAQVDKNAPGNLADGHVNDDSLQADQGRQHGDEDVGVETVEQDLENAIEGHQAGGILRVALGQVVPHNHHRDAAGQPDQDQADEVLRKDGFVGLQGKSS